MATRGKKLDKLGDDRRTSKTNSYNHITELTEQHNKIMDYLIGNDIHPPMSKSEVATIMEVSVGMISDITNSPMFAKKLREKKLIREKDSQAVNNRFADVAPTVQQELLDLTLHSKNEQVRLGAAKDWLDRAGFQPDKNINIRAAVVTANYSEEELARIIAQRLKSIDVEVVPENGEASE